MDKTPQEKVRAWFETPIMTLKDWQGGDAGFVPLMASFALAERLLTVLIQRDGKCKSKDRPEYLNKVLEVDLSIAEIFWTMYRDGMMHCGQPYNGKIHGEIWGWSIDRNHSHLPVACESKEKGKYIAIDPWKWFQHVVQKYSQYPEVRELPDLRRLGQIRNLQENQTSSRPVQHDISHQTDTGVYHLPVK